MDNDIARLVREERIAEAAELASRKGDAPLASELFERACEWSRAAREALLSGDPSRALVLAVTGGDESLAEQALPGVCADARAWERVVQKLEQQGHFAWAARILERTERGPRAARAWERAGESIRAAALYESAGDPVSAARVLEAQIRREPSAWGCHLALGQLLLRYGKFDPAVRALQKVPPGARERRAALTLMKQALEQLGLTSAAADAGRELETLGGPLHAEQQSSKSEVRRRIFGRYDVVREVASTATARVLECIDSVRGEHVAVKIFAGYDVRGGGRDALARFEREVRVLGKLDHPNIVPLRDYFDEGPAIVMPWMGGGTLEKMLEQPVAPARAVEIAQAVLSALGEAHRLGVLHRDIKPANVLFDDAGVARLADFGVAHLGDASTTATAGIIGTLAYMSPEQRAGKPATVQSDVYGVGAILFEMLTHERMQPNDPPKARPSGVHRDLDGRHDAVVMRMVAADPRERPADAFAARRLLGSLPWPSTLEPAALQPRQKSATSDRPGPMRLEESGVAAGRALDRWTGRVVERVRLTEGSLARARAFARAATTSLQTVLRVDRDLEEIWLEAPRGKVLDRGLSPAELERLRQAVDALHGEGVVHGHIDRSHVMLTEAGVLLLFDPDHDIGATADTDWADVARLASPPT
jgi:serine/threonine-protein kinase